MLVIVEWWFLFISWGGTSPPLLKIYQKIFARKVTCQNHKFRFPHNQFSNCEFFIKTVLSYGSHFAMLDFI